MPKHTALHPYAVYHATNPLAMLMPDPRAWQTDRDRQYRHIANVYAERSQVFALTNHSEGQDWTERPEVFWVAPGTSPRSTSVGDKSGKMIVPNNLFSSVCRPPLRDMLWYR